MPKYNDDILNYYKDDSHIGSLDADAKDVGTGLVGAPACGDVMKLQIKVKNDKIVDAKIMVFGCGSAKASSSYVAKKLTGMTLDEALKIKNTDIAEALGLPENEEVLMIMDLGYAAEGAGPLPNHESRKPLSETVTYL